VGCVNNNNNNNNNCYNDNKKKKKKKKTKTKTGSAVALSHISQRDAASAETTGLGLLGANCANIICSINCTFQLSDSSIRVGTTEANLNILICSPEFLAAWAWHCWPTHLSFRHDTRIVEPTVTF